jgi:ribosomal protein S10
MGTLLSSIDMSRISGHDQVIVLAAHDRMASHHAARRYQAMAAVHSTMLNYDGYPQPYEDAANSASAEVRAALRLTRRTSDNEMALALALHRRLPRLAEMLDTGSLDVRRARTIDAATVHLTDAQAQAVVDEIADIASELTTGQLRARVQKLCIDVDPGDAADRYERSVQDRRIVIEATADGTANLMGLDLPPDVAAAIRRFIHDTAVSLRVSGESRTMDQLRADVYMDLLQGIVPTVMETSSAGTAGGVEIVCDLETLARLEDHPGDLAGYGPVISDIARQIAQRQIDSDWRYTMVDDAGQPLHVGTTSRRPTPTQQRRVRARHRTCVFPGCRMPAIVCDIDHTISVADGGETCDCNLAPLCRHDHCIKHASGWTYTRTPDGRIRWTSPLGHVYETPPHRAPP